MAFSLIKNRKDRFVDSERRLVTYILDYSTPQVTSTDTNNETLLSEGELHGLLFLRGRYFYHIDAAFWDDSPADNIVHRLDWRMLYPETGASGTEVIHLLGKRFDEPTPAGAPGAANVVGNSALPGTPVDNNPGPTTNEELYWHVETNTSFPPASLIGEESWQTRLIFQLAATDASTNFDFRMRFLIIATFMDTA